MIELGLERKQYDRIERSWGLFETNFVRMKKFILDLIKYTKHYSLQKTESDLNQCVDSAINACEYVLKKMPSKFNFEKIKRFYRLRWIRIGSKRWSRT